MQLVVGVATNIGCVRQQNEDAYWYSDRIFVVCDGMGGHQAGEIAAKMAINVFKQHSFSTQRQIEDVINAVEKAHQVIYDAGQRPDMEGMGTTATIGVIDAKDKQYSLYLGHVGDSRAYLFRKDQMVQLTSDHSIVGELLRNGTLTQGEAANHPHRHVVTQAVGVGEIDIETRHLPLHSQDIVLFCTDGLTDVVEEMNIAHILSTESPQMAADKMIETALMAGGPDNITVLIVAIP